MKIQTFRQRKVAREKISMVTCYDFWSAQILADSSVDTLLVGDSLAMVMHGFPSTVHATVEMMATHIAAVKRGAPNKFIVGDMPFLAARKDLGQAMDAVTALMQAGSNAIKIEGAAGQLPLLAHIVESGVPVMGHLGLTPQSVESLGGHKVQGRLDADAQRIFNDALALQDAGCFSLVLECIPQALGERITLALDIPTIGIGAGPNTDGQVLVLQDLLGMQKAFKPKFLRHYMQGHELLSNALNHYHSDVVEGHFPSCQEVY
ncbi:MAG: 3-methyl-2-oxobutanoate hydroxymethyltransferase [Candidatus Azotimanducaceae bacterium]|jgi:3-methyl-2-oxobutanoate hydroxymethyltransferase|tara:strand:+ start:311 stop:1096 length:786 start_codon:yes stop_codon:yes gene_type:complete